jgi:translation initiation factor IF-1
MDYDIGMSIDHAAPGAQPARRALSTIAARRRPPRGSGTLGVAAFAVILTLIAVSCASAAGTRERGEDPPDGPLRGEVIAVRTASGGDAELTVRQPNGSEVYVIIPERLASSIRPRKGDRVVVEERRMARDGERLRVRTIQIERGR